MAANTPPAGTDLGRRIREQRARVGLSCDEIAQLAGLAPSYLAYLESSLAPNPAQATLTRLAAALGTSVGELCGAGLNLPLGQRAAATNPVLYPLTADDCRAMIKPGGLGRILFVEPGRGPVAIPVNYRMDGDDVVFRVSSRGPITAALQAPPEAAQAPAGADSPQASVSFDVDHLDEALGEGWSVLLTGSARLITDAAEVGRVGSLGVEPWAGGERETYVRLVVRQATGRAIRVTG
jgi:transcriptional regulator with XRE-family HTH domain